MYTAAVAAHAANSGPARILIDLLTSTDARDKRSQAGFVSG
jgi:hypothetical protein